MAEVRRPDAVPPDPCAFDFEQFRADPAHNELILLDSGERRRLEPRTMDVLVLLAAKAGQVVTRQELVSTVWAGRRVVDDSLSLCISNLRKVLGDSARDPRFIRTVPKRGYCFLPEVRPCSAPEQAQRGEADAPTESRRSRVGLVAALALLVVGGGLTAAFLERDATAPSTLYAAELDQLLSASGGQTLVMQGAAEGLRIEMHRLEDGRARLQLLDSAGSSVWSVERALATGADRRKALEEIAATIAAVNNRKTGPLLRALQPEQRGLFKRARYHLDRRTEEDLAKARELLEGILAQSPEAVDVLLALAEVHEGLARYDREATGPSAHLEARRLLIEQAGLVSPGHPAVRALLYRQPPGGVDWGQYEADLLSLVSEAPDCVACVQRLGDFYVEVGWYREALAVWEAHLGYWPLSVRLHSVIGRLYARMGDAEGALRQVELIRALAGSEAWDVYAAEANAYMSLGDTERWSDVMTEVLGRFKGVSPTRIAVVDALRTGDDARLAELAASSPEVRDFNLALTLGQVDHLIARLRRGMAQGNYRDLGLVHGWMHSDNPLTHHYLKGLAQLQADSRVTSLLESTGLIAFWREQKRFPDFCARAAMVPNYCG